MHRDLTKSTSSCELRTHSDMSNSVIDINYVRPAVMWMPDSSLRTHMKDFTDVVNAKYDLQLKSYSALYSWSCNNYANFWEAFWSYSNIVHSKPYNHVVDTAAKIQDIPEWFSGSLLNYAENLLRYDGDKVAIYATGEGQGGVRTVTFSELRRRVAQYAAAMKALGIRKGDRVVGYLPNCVEAVEAMLATASLGAVWSSTSPDFGIAGVLERFSQIRPKLLFSVPAVVYNCKQHDHLRKLVDVVRGLPDLLKVVLVPFAAVEAAIPFDLPNGLRLDEFLALGRGADGTVPNLDFAQVPFNHPLFIMYSSGTTGIPKCIIHSAGGTLIQHLKEHMLHGNMTDKDVLMYYTTTGWMMWNWMVTALALGSSIVLYDGSPLVPTYSVLWDLVDALGITVLGTGAKWLSVMEESRVHPKETHRLQFLHTILSTGSPLKPQSYDYVYDKVKSDVLLGSLSGGTDIIASFVGHNVTLPVYRGEIQGPMLAMAIECWSDEGKPVWGEKGELVCTKPHPSMPTGFWNDPGNMKYKNAYFSSAFKGVWYHGDFCLINPESGGIVMLGRSDGTLNPNGVRFGSAEIYGIVESFQEVEDSLCVAQRRNNGEEKVILFIKMAPGSTFSKDLVKKLQQTIRMQLSVRHVPANILETKDIPYTVNGKKVEVAVRDVISGLEVKNRSAIFNPECLDLFANMLQSNQI